ncbi:hypothetical protein L596_002768 [Steinernema carpocapsae]|uniref:Uncharacterized protein n=1 Tax=Steinernema carpocapsae TaxID=34508 RepID=A0A4U8UR36_STECR|nr:hypothetical protein L596_002768 [Steinernema carpocapsae]
MPWRRKHDWSVDRSRRRCYLQCRFRRSPLARRQYPIIHHLLTSTFGGRRGDRSAWPSGSVFGSSMESVVQARAGLQCFLGAICTATITKKNTLHRSSVFVFLNNWASVLCANHMEREKESQWPKLWIAEKVKKECGYLENQ